MNHSTDPREPKQVALNLLGTVALVLALCGQLALQTAPNWLAVGLALSTTGVLLFMWVVLRPPPIWVVSAIKRIRLSYSALWIAVATCLSVVATVVDVVFESLGKTNYAPVIALWVGTAVVYAAAFSANWRGWKEWRAWLQTCRAELIGLGLVTLAAGAVRFYQLGALPRVIDGDEGKLGQAALVTIRLPLANPFALFENFGAVYLHGINLALQVLGHTPFALRLLPAIGGTLAIPALYLLGRRLFGPRVGLAAAILLAASHAHIHFSRVVSVGYIQGTFLIPLELYFLVSGLENRSALRLALGGLILGFHSSVYLSAQIVAGYLFVYFLLLMLLSRQSIRPRLRDLMVFLYGTALIALPEVVYALRRPSEFLARLNADGTLQSGWLSMTVAATGQNAAQILLGRVAHTFLTLNHYPTLDFYGADAPLLDLVTGLLFLLGLAYALWRTRDHRFLLLNGYFWSATVAIGVFSVPPSADSYRMLVALPAAVLLAALGWEQVIQVLTLTSPDRRAALVSVSALMLVFVLAFNLRTYFTDFVNRCGYGGDVETRFASYLGNYTRTLDREASAYLLSDDAIRYGTHQSVDFLSGGLRVTNLPGPVAGLKPGTNSVIIGTASRADELRNWALERSDGKLYRVYDCERLMLLAYRIP